MSHTTTRPTKTSSRGSGTRGRGAGRGRQTRHNLAVSHSGLNDKDMDQNYTYNERRRGSSVFPRNQENRHSSVKGQKNFKVNQNSNSRPYMADNIPGDSEFSDTNLYRIPKHAQNPYFVGELMSRFNRMLPSSTLLEDEVDRGAQQPNVMFEPIKVLNPGTDSMRNNSIPRDFSNSNSNQKNDFGNMNKIANQGYKGNKMGNNMNPRKNHLNRTNENPPQTNIRDEEPHPASSSLLNRVRKLEHLKRDENSNRPNVSARYSNKKDSKLEQCFNSYDKEIPTSSNQSNDSPVITVTKTITQEQRKEILKNYGFSNESSGQTNPDNSKSNTTEDNKNELDLPKSLPCGHIASRTSPRVRYSLQNETTQNILSSVTNEQIKNKNLRLKPANQRVENSSRLNAPSVNVEEPLLSSNYTKPNSQNANRSKCSPGNSSDANLINGIKVKAENTTQLSGIAGDFFNRLDTLRSSNDPGTLKSPLNIKHAGKPGNRHSNNKVHNYNPFLVRNTPELIERHVTGSNHFSVNRPVRDSNERVASREEALERFQENYEIQRAVNEAKKKEKEAKKREEYLAKYKHVDQGHRLNEGLLDEAAGYAPGFDPFDSVETARERQQEALRQKTLDYQERMREKEEKEKRREEKKMKEKLEKNKHFNTGYRLGSSDNQVPLGIRRSTTPSALEKNKSPQASGKSDEKLSENSISPDLLLDGETEEEFCQRLEEHYMAEKLMKDQMERNWETFEGEKCTQDCDDNETQSLAGSADSVALNLCTKNISQAPTNPPVTSERQPPITPYLGPMRHIVQRELKQSAGSPIMGPSYPRAEYPTNGENTTEQFPEQNRYFKTSFMSKDSEPIPSRHIVQKQLNQTSNSSRMMPERSPAGYLLNVGNITEQTPEKIINSDKNVMTKDLKPSPAADHLGSKRQNQCPPLQQLGSKVCRSSVVQVPGSPQVTSPPDSSSKTPASCTLKNRNGAVLMLRPTAEELNRSLASKLEVHDEMDKLGYSTSYKPQTEQVPLFTNNRFERKSNLNTVEPRATGAIPKRASSLAINATLSDVAANSMPINKTPKQEEPPIDHKAEMLAARLRFQQQYEESLKRKQQQKDKSQD